MQEFAEACAALADPFMERRRINPLSDVPAGPGGARRPAGAGLLYDD